MEQTSKKDTRLNSLPNSASKLPNSQTEKKGENNNEQEDRTIKPLDNLWKYMVDLASYLDNHPIAIIFLLPLIPIGAYVGIYLMIASPLHPIMKALITIAIFITFSLTAHIRDQRG